MTAKLDLYKLHKAEYAAPRKPVLVETRPARYLAIAGHGTPGGTRFTACIAALYGMAFTIKMTNKFAGKQDYAVGKLECQWFFGDVPVESPKEKWRWRLLIRTPDFISSGDLKAAARKLQERGKSPEVGEVTIETIDEGICIHMLHIGPYEKENESLILMRRFADTKGLKLDRPQHEIYLSDPRRVPPARLKTILRVPVLKQDV